MPIVPTNTLNLCLLLITFFLGKRRKNKISWRWEHWERTRRKVKSYHATDIYCFLVDIKLRCLLGFFCSFVHNWATPNKAFGLCLDNYDPDIEKNYLISTWVMLSLTFCHIYGLPVQVKIMGFEKSWVFFHIIITALENFLFLWALRLTGNITFRQGEAPNLKANTAHGSIWLTNIPLLSLVLMQPNVVGNFHFHQYAKPNA